MKPRIPDSFRVMLARKYLDWAEKLPRFRGGIIALLQAAREHQRRWSEDTHRRSRAPEGCEVEYLYFRLIEMFQIEDFDQLREGVMQLLPGLQGSFREDFSADFTRNAETIAGGGYWRLGVILPERKGTFGYSVRPFREMAELPAEVDSINLSLHKILPSIFIVALDVHLTEEATRQLVQLQSKHYLSTVRFKSLVPWTIRRSGHSEEPAELVMRREILGWLEGLRGRVEACIRRYLSGYFMRHSPNKTARLPAIEVYTLRGVPAGEAAFESWRKNAREWLESLGFAISPIYAYASDRLIYAWARHDYVRPAPARRVAVLWEPYLRSINSDGFSGEKAAVAYHIASTLDALLTGITVDHFLQCVRTNVEKLRPVTFGSMRRSPASRYRFGRYHNLNYVLRQESMFLDRISMEFEHRSKWIRREMDELHDLKIIGGRPGAAETESLRDAILNSISFKIGLLKNHLSLVTRTFSDYLTTRNMEAVYRLTRRIFWLTIVVTVATIAGVGANWEGIQGVVRGLIDTIRRAW